MIEITLGECPQSTNSLYRYTDHGMYMTNKGQRLKEDYQLEARSQYDSTPFSSDCRVRIDFYFPTAHRRDIDNYSKIVLDSLEEVIYENDSQIQELVLVKHIDRDNPRVELEIEVQNM